MTYEELVEKARELFGKADVSGIDQHIAYQFNITGEAEGAFYLEVAGGEVHVEPYEYFDRDALFTTSAETLIKMGTGELDPMWAFTQGKVWLDGSIEKALLLKDISASLKIQMKPEAKTQKATAKKAVKKKSGYQRT